MSQNKKENKKEQILAAASECFARFGYKKTTLDDIGKKIGLNKASIYYYFKSKEEIFTSIVLGEFQQFISKLHQEIEEGMICEQKILVYFEEKLNFWFQKSMILPQITEIEPEKLQQLMEASGFETFLKIEQGEKSFLANILKNCIKKGQIKDCDVDKTSELMFALVDGVKGNYERSARAKSPPCPDHEKMMHNVQAALKIFINGLK
ncbi:MAG: TetR family transcriptional regulator [Promethearchaeota archaeon CR_4]|nr:MAG: TetR family transcriptional regulator [Candidatus Lokiarchaeota archaeon CR_4]